MNDFLLREQIKKLEEAIKLKELNLELLDTLEAIIFWLFTYTEKHNIPFEEERESLKRLLKRASLLIEDITESPFLKESAIRRDFTVEKYDEDLPEPRREFFIYQFYLKIWKRSVDHWTGIIRSRHCIKPASALM